MSDSEAKAEEHFKEYDMATVRIAAEDEIYYYAARAVRLWSFEQQNKRKKAGVSALKQRSMLLLFYFLFGFIEKIAVKEFPDRNIQTVTNNLYRHYTWIFAFGVEQTINC